jgi:hypothetical protein
LIVGPSQGHIPLKPMDDFGQDERTIEQGLMANILF